MPSSRFYQAIAAANTSERPAFLLTLTHASFSETVRLTDANADVVIDGASVGEDPGDVTYKAWAMQAPAPSDGPDASRRGARIVADNTDRWLLGQLSLAPTRPTARIDVVLLGRTAGEAPEVNATWSGLTLDSYAPGGGQIELEIKGRDDSEETWPFQTFSPKRTPGLFD